MLLSVVIKYVTIVFEKLCQDYSAIHGYQIYTNKANLCGITHAMAAKKMCC